MSVRKREWVTRSGEAKEAWIVDYTDQNGKRHIETFRQKKAAVDRQAKVHIDIGKGVHVAPSDSITVAEAAKNWLDHAAAAGLEDSTLLQYRQHVNLHIVPRIGRTKLAKLTRAQVEQFRTSIMPKAGGSEDDEDNKELPHLSLALARKVLTSLKSILKHAGYAHVAMGVTIKRSKRDRSLEAGRDFPEPSEVKRLVAATATPRQKALVLMAALTGLRASELRGLRWKADVDLKVGELKVQQRADRNNKIGPPKSKSSMRSIPLPPELVTALKEWKVGCPKGREGLVFPTREGTVQDHANLLASLEAVMKTAHVVDQDGKPSTGCTPCGISSPRGALTRRIGAGVNCRRSRSNNCSDTLRSS